jgi:hypothetical protein
VKRFGGPTALPNGIFINHINTFSPEDSAARLTRTRGRRIVPTRFFDGAKRARPVLKDIAARSALS